VTLVNEETDDMACCDNVAKRQSLVTSIAKKVAEGAVGVMTYALGRHQADEKTVRYRDEMCRICDIRVGDRCGALFGSGPGCGCYLPQKIRISGSSCPIEKWGPAISSTQEE
jgi:hypothetical protein